MRQYEAGFQIQVLLFGSDIFPDQQKKRIHEKTAQKQALNTSKNGVDHI